MKQFPQTILIATTNKVSIWTSSSNLLTLSIKYYWSFKFVHDTTATIMSGAAGADAATTKRSWIATVVMVGEDEQANWNEGVTTDDE